MVPYGLADPDLYENVTNSDQRVLLHLSYVSYDGIIRFLVVMGVGARQRFIGRCKTLVFVTESV